MEEKNQEKTKTPKAPLGERIEDKLDDVVGGLQDAIYGPGDDFTNDIPAQMEHPSGIRRINKVQTRRNLNKRLFKTKFFKVILVIIGIIALFMFLTSMLAFII